MTTLEINLPSAIAKRARDAGLLSAAAITEMFEEALRRKAGRTLLDHLDKIEDANLPEITPEEVAEEIRATRAERRKRMA